MIRKETKVGNHESGKLLRTHTLGCRLQALDLQARETAALPALLSTAGLTERGRPERHRPGVGGE